MEEQEEGKQRMKSKNMRKKIIEVEEQKEGRKSRRTRRNTSRKRMRGGMGEERELRYEEGKRRRNKRRRNRRRKGNGRITVVTFMRCG